ncbi:MAG: hypothetical protein JNL60_19795 [Bacteroidia bacterium]|nr:hypothetical protein [Bacteroidia bacterium]
MVQLKIKILTMASLLVACTKDRGIPDNASSYPENIASIMLGKCSVSGCHNSQSKQAAAGLSLSSWSELFEGSRNGSVVIPFRPDFSTLCYYTNSIPTLGPSLNPNMPLNDKPIPVEEYNEIKTWITNGAPDSKGNIKYANSSGKFYITNQLCDLVTAVDETTKLPARYINVGILNKVEFPVCIKVSPDKKNWYVSFLASPILQKFNCDKDAPESYVDLGNGVWSSFVISSDSKYAYCANASKNGEIIKVDLKTMQLSGSIHDPLLVYPRCISLDNYHKKLYVGSENQHYICILNLEGNKKSKQIPLGNSTAIAITTDSESGRCFVGCAESNEIKCIETVHDSIIASVYLGTTPGNIEHIKSTNKLLVTCFDDSVSFPGYIGSLKIINLATMQVEKTIYPGCQPAGIKSNSSKSFALIVNSNISPKGPKPHHITGCGGRNGFISFLNLETLEIMPSKKYELAVYPSAIDLR